MIEQIEENNKLYLNKQRNQTMHIYLSMAMSCERMAYPVVFKRDLQNYQDEI